MTPTTNRLDVVTVADGARSAAKGAVRQAIGSTVPFV